MSEKKKKSTGSDRRSFLRNSGMLIAGGTVAASNLSIARGAHAFGSDTIKVGLIGCGGRGTGAATQALDTSGDVKLVAMADTFENRMQAAIRSIKGKHPDRFAVDEDSKFVGLEGYKGVIASDCDLVILATPPGFRPLHFEAAVEAGKHVFMEKPVATDAPGVRRVLAANEKAKEKGLAVQVGLQRHHQSNYRQLMAKIHDGALGDLVMARAYWNGGGVWTRNRQANQTELEYQVFNWYYFNWLCGDHIDEQHIHNLDVINWAMQSYPVEAQGQGGREVRTSNANGQIFDHHFVEFVYDLGDGKSSRMLSQCRHIPNCWNSVSEHVHGTKGSCEISSNSPGKIYDLKGNQIWQSEGEIENGWAEEHHDMFAALRRGEVPNEGEYGAKSTMTAIMGRMATYSGKMIKWDDAINSDNNLANVDELTSWDSEAPVQPDEDGNYPVPVPGQTKVL